MPNELRTIRTFYNQEQCKMYYPPQLVIIHSAEYAAILIRKGAVERVSIAPGTPINNQTPVVETTSRIPVSGFASETIETKQTTPRRAKRN